MQCSACQAETQNGDSLCPACAAKLKPRSPKPARNRRRDPQGPVSPETEARHRAARKAFRVGVAGLVPGLGLVLGPLAVVLGGLVRRQAIRDPQFSLWGPAYAAIGLGGVVTVCNWVGFTLMFLGLRSSGVL